MLDHFFLRVGVIDNDPVLSDLLPSLLSDLLPSLQFVPFFSLLRKHSEVYNLDDGSGRDYRRGHHRLQLFLSQAEETSATRMDAAFAFLAGTFVKTLKLPWNAVSKLCRINRHFISDSFDKFCITVVEIL